MLKTTIRRGRAPEPARYAAALLFALLGHLVLMASPLHASAVHPDEAGAVLAAEHSMVERGHDGTDGRADADPTRLGRDGLVHCGLELVPPPDQSPRRLLAAAAPPLKRPPFLGSSVTDAQLARALGPPRTADSQALLQVFRI